MTKCFAGNADADARYPDADPADATQYGYADTDTGFVFVLCPCAVYVESND